MSVRPQQAPTASAPDTGWQSSALRVVFKNVYVHVPSRHEKGERLQLLYGVSAVAEPLQMTALMGPSGSGKTTLLDVLAGRKTTGNVSGVIKFGNATPSPAFLRRYTGYVEQFDTLIGSLTVKEMLMYTAELKRSMSESHNSKAQAVADLIERLGLTSCARVKIGDPLTKGISGGQAKRTNIGIALISDPKVLFLDEPTSGLDSYSANEVISLVQGLSREGTTVVATIHQPSAQAFAMFDQVLLLVRGMTAYFGPLGDAAEYAQQHWPAAKTPRLNCSLPEFLVDIVTEADRSDQAEVLAMLYSTSQLSEDNDDKLAEYLAHSSNPEASDQRQQTQLHARGDAVPDTHVRAEGQPSGSSRAPATVTIKAHAAVRLPPLFPAKATKTPRGFRPDIRSITEVAGVSTPSGHQGNERTQPRTQTAKSAGHIHKELGTRDATATPWWHALLVLLRYRALNNYKSPFWMASRLVDKLLFSFLLITLYLKTGDDMSQENIMNMTASLFMWCGLPTFGSATYMPNIVAERPLFYRERADGLYYVGTYYLAKMIEEIVIAAAACLVLSACVFYGINYQGSFALFWLVYFMTVAIGVVLGYFIAAAVPNIDLANTALFGYGVTLLFFTGQIAVIQSMPRYWRWFSRIDYVRYSWNALILNQYGEYDPLYITGTTVLQYYGMSEEHKWTNFALLFPFFAFYTLLGYLAMAFARHSHR